MESDSTQTKTIIPHRVVVTGATGFLGFHTAKTLAERGHDVLGLGRNIARGKELEEHGVAFVRCELSDVKRLRQAFRGFDTVVHCAALTRSGALPEAYRLANYIGTRNVMTAMQDGDVKRWIHISDARLYGGHGSIAIRETEPLIPYSDDPYLETKRLNEIDIDNFIAVPSIILRPMVIFGPGDRRLLPYLQRLARLKKIAVFDNGDADIDPVYVGNVVDAILCAIRANPRAEGKAFNISNRTPVNAVAFLTSLAETTGRLVYPFRMRRETALRIGLFLETLYRFLGVHSETPLPSSYVRLFSDSLSLNGDASDDLLGYKPKIALQQAIRFMNGTRRT